MEKQITQKEYELMNANWQNDIEDEIDLVEVFFTILHGWKAILMAVLVGAVILGSYHSFFVKSSYQADVKIFITKTDSENDLSYADVQISSALTDDYTEIIKSRTVLNLVIEELGLDMTYTDLEEMIQVENPQSTHIIHMLVTCDDLEMARDIANTLLNVSVDQIYQIVGNSKPTVFDYAKAESVIDVTPSLIIYMAIGGMIGAVLVCVVLVIRMLTNSTMKTEEDIEKYLGLPVLAVVPYYKEK